MCNNKFDCIEKKSLLKEVIYDYEIKTTQDIKEAENESYSIDSYELSTNGKCPQYCVQCNNLGNCLNCKKEYGIYDINNLLKCKSIEELNHGYYKNKNILYFSIILCH